MGWGVSRTGTACAIIAACALAGPAKIASAADIYTAEPAAPAYYVATTQSGVYFGASARFVAGELSREGSGFFRLWKNNGNNTYTLLTPNFVTFSADGDFKGYEAEVFAGRRWGDKSLEIVAGGGSIWSDSSFSGFKYANPAINKDGFLLTISSPTPNQGAGQQPGGNTTFNWFDTNRFDVGNIKYTNSFRRDDGFIGIRPGFLFGGDPASLKDGGSLKDPPAYAIGGGHLVQPMIFLTAGRITVGERFSGATDGDSAYKDLNVQFSYNNSITSDFYGGGIGLSAKGPLLDTGFLRIGYFGGVKGAIEVQNADGRALWTYAQGVPSLDPNSFGTVGCQGGQPSGACNTFNLNSTAAKSSVKSVSADETTYSLSAEVGLTFGLFAGVDLDVGARYRRYDVPQMIVNGVDDAHIKFTGADEIGGFVGLKTQF